MKSFAVLQLSGCAGCEVSLLNAGAWIDRIRLEYMPLVISACDVWKLRGDRSSIDIASNRVASPMWSS